MILAGSVTFLCNFKYNEVPTCTGANPNVILHEINAAEI